MGMDVRPVHKGVDSLFNAFRIDVDEEIDSEFLRHALAKFNHLTEFPGGVNVKEREGRFRRIERLHRQMQHHRRIFADGIQHHRLGEVRGYLSEDMNGLGFKALKMRKIQGNSSK
jgi:hypothetical protein